MIRAQLDELGIPFLQGGEQSSSAHCFSGDI